jgi:hypothetical protein
MRAVKTTTWASRHEPPLSRLQSADGPNEARSCLSCKKRPPMSNHDRIVAVLEQSQKPLNTWDIARKARALYGHSVWLAYLSADERLGAMRDRTVAILRLGPLPAVGD